MPDCWRWEGSEEEASVGWLPTLLVKVIRYFVMTLHSPSSSPTLSGVPMRSVCPGPGGGGDLSQRSEVTGSLAIYLVLIVWKVALSMYMYGIWLGIRYIYVTYLLMWLVYLLIIASLQSALVLIVFFVTYNTRYWWGHITIEEGQPFLVMFDAQVQSAGKNNNMWLNFVPRLVVYILGVHILFVGCCLATNSLTLNNKVEWVEMVVGVALGC